MTYARPRRGKPERWVREAAGNDDVEGIAPEQIETITQHA